MKEDKQSMKCLAWKSDMIALICRLGNPGLTANIVTLEDRHRVQCNIK